MADYQLSDIEDFFNSQRAKVRWPFKRLDPLDWAMMDGWQKDGVPFSCICRGIEETITNHVRRQAQGRVNTVRYCEQAIKRHWKDHVAAHVGGSDVVTGHQAEFGDDHMKGTFQCWIDRLQELANEYSHGSENIHFAVAVGAVARGLIELRDSLAPTMNLESLDAELSTLENLLMEVLLSFIGQAEFDALASNAEKDLASYKDRMRPNLWADTVRNNVLKKLREQYRIPRLSLFYL